MPRVYDCFTYFNEERILDLRLKTLTDVVDTFIIIEATHTFTGRPKKLSFDFDRYPNFRDRIRYIVVEDLPLSQADPWANESFQRNAILRGLIEAREDDRIIISDVDEIPHPATIGQYDQRYLCGTFHQRFFSYLLNNLAVQPKQPERERRWILSKITTAAHLRDFWETPQNLRLPAPPRTARAWLHYLRWKFGEQKLTPGGWHFAWVMSPERMIHKMESYSHTETDRDEFKSTSAIEAAIRDGRDILGKGERFRRIRLDETFPEPIRANPESYADLIGAVN